MGISSISLKRQQVFKETQNEVRGRFYPKGKPGLLWLPSLCTQSHTSRHLQCLCAWNPKSLGSKVGPEGKASPSAFEPILICNVGRHCHLKSHVGRHCHLKAQLENQQAQAPQQPMTAAALLAKEPTCSLHLSIKVLHTQLFPDISMVRKKNSLLGFIYDLVYDQFSQMISA